ncbi:MAG: ABC-2 family transporter protein [Chloroflexi bacterium]|nr:ABC-2 family transporter protein [Chloroflexota bacterium]
MVNKIRVILRVYWSLALEYRAETLIWMMTSILPLFMLAVWSTVSQQGAVGGYTQAGFVAYYIATLFVRQVVGVWIIWDMDYDIRYGELSPKLLKPLDPAIYWIAGNIMSKPVRLLILLPLLTAVGWSLPPEVAYRTDLLTLLAFLLSLLGAWGLAFFIQYSMGLLSFWMTQVLALNDLWFGVWSLFSGYLIPLDLLPPAIRVSATILPFRYMLSLPVEILLGKVAGVELVRLLLVQAAWLVVGWVVSRLLWRAGLRRYSAVGA